MNNQKKYLVLSGAPGRYLRRAQAGKLVWVDSPGKATPFLTYEGAKHFALKMGGVVGSVVYQNPQREFAL